MSVIPDQYRDLLEKPVVVSLATILPSGQPQVTPVWVDFDGTYLRVNTAEGRRKYHDMVDRPQVTVMALDPENPYRYLEVRGKVVRYTTEGGREHINALSNKYTGNPIYPGPADETRVTFFIEPQKISTMG